jgi:5-methylcytosine-specific restriction protein A
LPSRPAFEGQGNASELADFYNSAAWRKLSLSFRIDNPLCIECAKKGIVSASQVADHIVPIKQGGDRYDRGNLQALCHSCHNRKSAKEKGGGGCKSL